VPEQMPRVLEIAMRFALERGGVAVVVVLGEVFSAPASNGARPRVIRRTASVIRPGDDQLIAAAEILNRAQAVTILAGAGCRGAHDELMAVAGTLKAPVVHALAARSSLSTTIRMTWG
jgi:pyruvate dehydrogenase (quinone)